MPVDWIPAWSGPIVIPERRRISAGSADIRFSGGQFIVRLGDPVLGQLR